MSTTLEFQEQELNKNNKEQNYVNTYYGLFLKHKRETITYCFVFWSFGMCVALLGPTLIDLGCRTSNLFSTMSWTFFAQNLCTLIGSASGGLLSQRYGQHKILFVACIMLTLTLSIVGITKHILFLTLVLGIMGYFMGIIDTVANLSMLSIYRENSPPFLQALHFFYGLGAFLSPIISLPFLLVDDCNKLITANTIMNETIVNEITQYTLLHNSHISKIQYAFWIMALLQLPVVFMVYSLIVKDANRVETDDLMEEMKISPINSENEKAVVSETQTFYISILTSAILFLNDGLQASFGGFIYSFGLKSSAKLSITKAVYLNACFWGTFAIGRLLSIWISIKLSSVFMLFCNITGCFVAVVLMALISHSHFVLFFGTCMLGLFLSSVYPTAISLADMYIKLTSEITTVMVVSAAAGEMSMPLILGHEFDVYGAGSFLVTGLIITSLSIIVYFVLFTIGTSILRPTASRGRFGGLKSIFGQNENSSLLMRHEIKYYSRMRSDSVIEATDSELNTEQETTLNY